MTRVLSLFRFISNGLCIAIWPDAIPLVGWVLWVNLVDAALAGALLGIGGFAMLHVMSSLAYAGTAPLPPLPGIPSWVLSVMGLVGWVLHVVIKDWFLPRARRRTAEHWEERRRGPCPTSMESEIENLKDQLDQQRRINRNVEQQLESIYKALGFNGEKKYSKN